MSDLLDYHDALNTLLATHEPLAGVDSVPLMELANRVLAQDIAVQHDVPAFDNSAMDGYAICGNGLEQWQVVQRIAAGDRSGAALQPGQAARIFTGAPLPHGATAVLMQEHVIADTQAGTVSLQAPGSRHSPASGPSGAQQGGPGESRPRISDGQNIRRRAEELQRGTTLLEQYQRITPPAVGLLSHQGYTHAPCVPQVRVTVFSSGNELVEPGGILQDGQIYDSNRQMLTAMLRALGFVVIDGGILPDSLEPTRAALAKAAKESDAILCSGGVSVGEEDHLKAALSEVGELTQWRLRIKPGKPFTWGRIGACRVFMLPGNPVSSLVTFHLLALPALRRLSGVSVDDARPWKLPARAGFTRSKVDSRREFLRVMVQAGPDGLRVAPVSQQGSNMLSAAVFAHALAEIPPDAQVEHGMELAVYPLADRF